LRGDGELRASFWVLAASCSVEGEVVGHQRGVPSMIQPGLSSSVAEPSRTTAPVHAYLLSFLALQYLVLRDRFADRYPHSWLAWEPGAWSVPAREDTHSTRLPVAQPVVGGHMQSDALCFELAPRPLRLGRAESSDIPINDATVSRDHLLLTADRDEHWLLTSASARGTRVGAMLVPPGRSVELWTGVRVTAGAAVFTFLGPMDFLERTIRVAANIKR
jgi:hypothetical protein